MFEDYLEGCWRPIFRGMLCCCEQRGLWYPPALEILLYHKEPLLLRF